MTAATAELLAAGIDVGPEAVAYVGVGGMLALLFRLVMRTLSVKDVEMVRLVEQMRQERDRAHAWAEYHRQRAEHYYAVSLHDPNPPPLPNPPKQPPPSVPPFIPPTD